MVDTQLLHLSPTAVNIHVVAGLFGGAVVSSASLGQGAPGQGER